jgi:hypothetical protein
MQRESRNLGLFNGTTRVDLIWLDGLLQPKSLATTEGQKAKFLRHMRPVENKIMSCQLLRKTA